MDFEQECKKAALKEVVQYLVDACKEVSDVIQEIDEDEQFKSQMKKLKKLMKQVQFMNEHGKMQEKPNKKPSAYNNFIKERIENFQKYTFMTSQERMAKAASEWRLLTSEEKAKYKY